MLCDRLYITLEYPSSDGIRSVLHEPDILQSLPGSCYVIQTHLKMRANVDAKKQFKILNCYLVLVERVLSDRSRTVPGVEVLSGHQTAAEDQSNNKQRLEHLDDSCDFSSGERHNLYLEYSRQHVATWGCKALFVPHEYFKAETCLLYGQQQSWTQICCMFWGLLLWRMHELTNEQTIYRNVCSRKWKSPWP
jgi:hypothetical protein